MKDTDTTGTPSVHMIAKKIEVLANGYESNPRLKSSENRKHTKTTSTDYRQERNHGIPPPKHANRNHGIPPPKHTAIE